MEEEDIAAAALLMPPEARASLADRLVESLDPAESGSLHDLWAKEVNRRLNELRTGSVTALPGPETIAALRQKYGG